MKFLTAILLLMFFQVGKAQEISRTAFRFGLSHGLGFYLEKDLKDLNKELAKSLPFEVETVNNFPSQSFLGGYFLVQTGSSFSIGPVYQFHSTGSRMGIKDYSGSYSLDQIINSNMVGLRAEINLNKIGSSKILFHFDVGIDFAKWKIKHELILGNDEDNYEITYVAMCPYIEPSLGLKWEVSRVITISVQPAFHIDLGGKYRLKNNRDVKSEVRPTWNGPRISFNIDYKSSW